MPPLTFSYKLWLVEVCRFCQVASKSWPVRGLNVLVASEYSVSNSWRSVRGLPGKTLPHCCFKKKQSASLYNIRSWILVFPAYAVFNSFGRCWYLPLLGVSCSVFPNEQRCFSHHSVCPVVTSAANRRRKRHPTGEHAIPHIGFLYCRWHLIVFS